MKRVMLSTIDNPHSPFDDFPAWFSYDQSSGYNSSGFLARITRASHTQSEADYEQAIEEAVDEIVKENVLGIFIKVERDFPDNE